MFLMHEMGWTREELEGESALDIERLKLFIGGLKKAQSKPASTDGSSGKNKRG